MNRVPPHERVGTAAHWVGLPYELGLAFKPVSYRFGALGSPTSHLIGTGGGDSKLIGPSSLRQSHDQSLPGCRARVFNLQSFFTFCYLQQWLLQGLSTSELWWEEPFPQQGCVSSKLLSAEERAGALVFRQHHSSGKM